VSLVQLLLGVNGLIGGMDWVSQRMKSVNLLNPPIRCHFQ